MKPPIRELVYLLICILKDNMFTINIIDETNHVSKSFVKANSFILEKYSDEFTQSSNKSRLLKELWLSEYKAVLNNTSIEFNKTTDMSMFLLRWS